MGWTTIHPSKVTQINQGSAKMTYVEMIEDSQGNLVDINCFDSAWCFNESTGRDSYGSAWPGGMETDYDVHCHNCGDLMWHGLES
jgi:hypothetical protein